MPENEQRGNFQYSERIQRMIDKNNGIIPGVGQVEVSQTEINTEEIQRKKQIGEDLKFVLEKVKKEVRNNPDLNDKYRKDLNESKSRLKGEDIDVDAYIREGYNVSREGNEELGRRKGVLMGIIEKMKDGGELSEGEKVIIDKIGLKNEDILVKQEEPKAAATVDVEIEEEKTTTQKSEREPLAVANETRKSIETVFSEEEEAKIIQQCLNLIFIQSVESEQKLRKSLLEDYIQEELRPGEDVHYSRRLIEKMDKLKLSNWIDMRNTVSYWGEFKNTEDIVPSTITKKLFLDPTTENFFAIGVCEIPFKNGNSVKLRRVDMGKEIGSAMRKLHSFFESGPDYWLYVNSESSERAKLYEEQGIDSKYVGEAAFSLLLTYQMLTKYSKEDYLGMMVSQSPGRIRRYTKSGDDAFVRMLVQDDLANRGDLFKSSDTDKRDSDIERTKIMLRNLLSDQLIPTGLSNGGEEALENGTWPVWRNEKYYPASQIGIDRAAGKEAKKANDQETRIAMMKSALNILQGIKDLQKPDTNVSQLGLLVGKLYAHVNGSLRDANWLDKADPNNPESELLLPAEMCFSDPNNPERMKACTPKDWVSRNMLAVCEMVVYSHSIVDHMNPKPWSSFDFVNNVEQMFSIDAQSDKPFFIGMDSETRKRYRMDLLNYADKIWSYSYEIAEKVRKSGNNPNGFFNKFPSWWSNKVSVNADVYKVAANFREAGGKWLSVSDRIKKNIKKGY
jgi:hypothetical protein